MRVVAELMSQLLVLIGILTLVVAGDLNDVMRFCVNVAGGMFVLIGLDWRIGQIVKKHRND